jgi:hypothetical protein
MARIFLFPVRLVTPVAAGNQGRQSGKDGDAALRRAPGMLFRAEGRRQNEVPAQERQASISS